MKLEGALAGVPDLFLAHPVAPYVGCFVELKMPPNKPSPEQQDLLARFAAEGYVALWCDTYADATELLTRYMEGTLS